MKNNQDQNKDEEKRIVSILHLLPPEYVRKVRIYAETLLEIFRNKR